MIGEHILKWEGGQHVFKLCTRAMAQIENATGLPFAQAMASVGDDTGFRITRLVDIIRPMMNAGQGGTEDDAYQLIDEIGLEEAGLAIGAAAEKAFPDLKKAAPGNAPARKPAKS